MPYKDRFILYPTPKSNHFKETQLRRAELLAETQNQSYGSD